MPLTYVDAFKGTLGVQNGATYWHLRSKQALLEAMADTLLAGLTAGLDTESPWTGRITELARRLRRALLSRRDGARLFSAAFFPCPARWPTARPLDRQRHPHMYAALAHISAPHHQEHFDYGLHLIVNGIRADTERP
jgi:TetR/AcrR family tetracycline transcriptional repressor